ncbi:putative ribonuclease H-like domain-containing protein [Tanacetum coccineum]
MESVPAQVVAAAKLPVLNPNEFELWKMRIEQYFLMTDYALWEVILNGDSPLPTRTVDGVETVYRSLLLQSASSKEKELKKKSLMEAIEKRFGGNKESKKVQKTLLKQQYENFNGKSSEGLDQIYDRLQKLISQLEIHGETISQEDLNLKLLRSLPSEWKTHTLIWRNKPDLETLSMDDLYNNTGSTNEAVKTAQGVSAALTERCHFARGEQAPNYKTTQTEDNKKDSEEGPYQFLHLGLYFFQGPSRFTSNSDTERLDQCVLNKNETVFEEDIKILKLDILLRDNALTGHRKKFEKADDLKLTIEKFENSSKNLSNLLDIQNFVKSNEHVKSPKESVKKVENNKQAKYLRKNSQSPRVYRCVDNLNMPNLEEIDYSNNDEGVGSEADMNNLDTFIHVSPIPTTRIHTGHPVKQIIGDTHSAPQTKRMTKSVTEHWYGLFQVQLRINKKRFHELSICLTLVDLPYGKRAIGTKWIYRNKKDERGIVVRNKARLVVQGYTQEEGIDYDEVFATVARIEAIRLFLAYASFKDFVVYQMDVKSAFLYGKIEEEVYVCQPPGFEDPEFPDKVYKVEKALFGLHQAPRAWYETLSTYLLDNRIQRGQIDKTLFIKRVKSDILLVEVYVDDIIFGSTRKEMCTEFENMMHKKFQMSSMGELTFFLGLQVTQKDDGIFISQDKYVDEILKKFGFSTVKTASTPMETSKPLMKDENAEDVDVHLYRSMNGSLISKDSPDTGFKPSGEEEKKDVEALENEDSEVLNTKEPRVNQEKDENVNSTNNINNVSSAINTASIEDNDVDENIVYGCVDDLNMPNLEGIDYSNDDEGVGVETDMNNLDTFMPVSPIPTTKIHKDHPVEQIIRDIHSVPQTRRMTKSVTKHGMFSSVQQRINHKDFQNCLFDCFLSQAKTKKVEAIWLFLSYASFKDYVVYQMDVKSAFLYGKIEKEVYVCHPPRFEDREFPDRIASTPMETSKPLLKDENAKGVDVHLYRSMIGSLMCLTSSSPDIMFVEIHNMRLSNSWKKTDFMAMQEANCVKNPVFHSTTKYIEIRHHFIRDSNEKKLNQTIKIHTDQNVVDLLTKAFDVSRFKYLIASIGMLNL